MSVGKKKQGHQNHYVASKTEKVVKKQIFEKKSVRVNFPLKVLTLATPYSEKISILQEKNFIKRLT